MLSLAGQHMALLLIEEGLELEHTALLPGHIQAAFQAAMDQEEALYKRGLTKQVVWAHPMCHESSSKLMPDKDCTWSC